MVEEDEASDVLRRLAQLRTQMAIVRTGLRGIGCDKLVERRIVFAMEAVNEVERLALDQLKRNRLEQRA